MPVYSGRLAELLDAGTPKEAAIAQVQEEYYAHHGVEPARPTFQAWLGVYRKACDPDL